MEGAKKQEEGSSKKRDRGDEDDEWSEILLSRSRLKLRSLGRRLGMTPNVALACPLTVLAVDFASRRERYLLKTATGRRYAEGHE